ncbi:MAG: acetolactate decarboxylase [Gammaproteobacteria bacterium]
MYQFSTFTHIMQQHYEGRISIDSLQSRGNHGLGTFADLEGELVAIDGQYFQCVDFSCRLADASQLLAWAAVCDFVAPDIVDQTIQGTYLDNQFSAWNTQLNDKLAAIKIHGLMEKNITYQHS